jgi:hypothetical protein
MNAIFQVVAFLQRKVTRARMRLAASLLLKDHNSEGALREFNALDTVDLIDNPEVG